ncbi:MAG: response regulator [Alphaproteobacteria bacterium]|nr:response regulator [Alphaproteobacteria bacterium]
MKKCLVVDDVEVSRYTNQMFLEDMGYDVVEAHDSQSCMAALGGGGVNLILLDWHLKKENGLDLLKQIRGSSHGGTVPVIVISGVEGMDKAQEALSAGANSFMTKPTTREKLEAELKKVGAL